MRRNDSDSLHALHGRFLRQFTDGDEDLTEGQLRLWDEVIGELVWRSYRQRRQYRRCHCAVCRVDTSGVSTTPDAFVVDDAPERPGWSVRPHHA